MNFELKSRLQERLKREDGCYIKRGAKCNFLLLYPNVYKVGMSNLGIHIVYDLLNKRDNVCCERGFLPDAGDLALYKKSKTPLMSLETQRPFCNFNIVGFAISFEMDYFNVVSMLKMGNIEPLRVKRNGNSPLVIAGGPCATFNPEPLADFFDAFIIGEGEAIMPEFMDVYENAVKNGFAKREILQALATVNGVYVPSLYEHCYDDKGMIIKIKNLQNAPERVHRNWVKNLDEHSAHTVVVTNETEFNLYLVETARGCGRHCRFCMAGYAFRKPRNRALDKIMEAVGEGKKYLKRIGLMGAAISDYPEINELSKRILEENLEMSVASFRADSATEILIKNLAESGLKTLTIAPEAGSAKLRKVINKGIEEEHIFKTIDMGIKFGIINFKLYFMVGLPFEDDEDIVEICNLAIKLRKFMNENNGNGLLTLSVNPFVPKPFTPFQWLSMTDKKIIKSRIKHIEKSLRKERKIKVIFESPKEALVQGILARGDRRLSEAILISAERGGVKYFLDAMGEKKLSSDFYLSRVREKTEIFPWQTIDIGVKMEYLYKELILAKNLEPTKPCFDGCKRCGVC